MKVVLQKNGETRQDYLIRVVVALLKENAYSMNNVVYDEAECDALCLIEDLENEFNLIKEYDIK